MRINKVKLSNFAQHKNLEVDISENIVGIIGRNGSGKSNFASSISMAITGEFGKKKKKDLITFGEKSGSIYVEGSIRNKNFVVNRSLDSNTTNLSYNSEIFDGAETVNEKFLELLDCDKSFLPNMVFVTQTDILGILFGKQAERNKMLQKFFGLEKAAKIELLLGQWKSNLSYPVIIDEDQLTGSIARLQEMLDENTKTIEIKKQKIQELSNETSGIDENKIYNNYKKALRKENLVSEIDTLNDNIELRKKELDNLKSPNIDDDYLDSIKQRIESLDLSIGSCASEIETLEVIGKHSGSNTGNCPLCGMSIDSDIINKLSEKLNGAKEKLKTQSSMSKQAKIDLKDVENKKYSYENKRSSLTSNIASYTSSKNKAESELKSGDFPKFSSDIYLNGFNSHKAALNEIKSSVSEVNLLESSNSKILDQINKSQIDLQNCKNIKSKFTGIKIHESRVSRIRDVFRYDGVSGRYVNYQMNKMCSSINQYLASFHAEYRVSVDEENEFICDFGNKVRPSSDLSCGQKVVLSLAFRFASCEVFSSGVDLIVLDEPTTWLDKETILNFKGIIESISELSDSNNLQVLLVTHERSLIPYFRQTIEF
jgi:DNA repair exonuclease SbcCD ATPase subunit